MTTWYRTKKSRIRIEKIEVVHSTDKQVVLSIHGREHRRAKNSKFEQYFPTFQQAKGYLLARVKSTIANLKADLATKEAESNTVGSLTEADVKEPFGL